MTKERLKHLLYHYVLHYYGLFIVQLISSTYRIKLVDPGKEKNCWTKRQIWSVPERVKEIF